MKVTTRVSATYFDSARSFRLWLEKYHATETELLVGFHKRHTGKPTLTWKESVDEALCFGWIDGVRKRVSDDAYTIRFTPRKPKSIWSAVNIKRMEELIGLGLVYPAGINIFLARDENRTRQYSFEQRKTIELSTEFEKQFKANKAAWKYFQSMPPSYRKPAIWWVVSAKQETTRIRRLNTLISDSEAGKKIKPLSY